MKIIKMDDQRHKEEFKNVSENCPWRHGLPGSHFTSNGYCEATEKRKPCDEVNCAVFHFKKMFEGGV